MYSWIAMDSEYVDGNLSPNYFRAHIASMSPRESLQPLINKFRRLDYLNRPPWAGGEHELILEESSYTPPVRSTLSHPLCGRFDDEECFRGSEKRYQDILHMRHLKVMYLECGWDVDAVVQTAFRRDEFLEKRKQFLNAFYKEHLDEIERRREL